MKFSSLVKAYLIVSSIGYMIMATFFRPEHVTPVEGALVVLIGMGQLYAAFKLKGAI